MDVDVLLVGGGVASARCARTLRRNGFDGSILLVGEEELPPYNRPPLSKELLRGEAPEELLAAEPPGWYERHAVQLRTGAAVTRLDVDHRTAMLDDGAEISFGRCMLATGARPRPLPVPGGEQALLLRTAADARRLRTAAAEAGPGAEVLVVGGGLIGVEVASGLASLGLRPTIVELSPALWAGALGRLLSAWAADRLRGAGVELRLGASVTRLENGGARIGDETVTAAFVVAGVGVVPRDELAVAAGIGASTGILAGVDARTSHPAVWAAGDATRVEGRAGEHWHAARESGERAALSMLGLSVPELAVPWTFSEVAGIPIDVFGDPAQVDHEQWLGDGRAVLRAWRGTPVQVAVVGGAPDPAPIRRLLASGAQRSELEAVIGV